MRLNYVKRMICIALCVALMAPVMLSSVSADWWGTGGSVSMPSNSLSDFTIRVGIYYASNALKSANLSNEVGSGYRFGYYDAGNEFHSLGYTYNEDITVLKDSNYYTSGGSYSDDPYSGGNLVGAYHLQLPNWFSSYEEALAAAQSYSYGFPAYVNGGYVVRFEYFSTLENAYAAAMNYSNVAVVGGSSTGYTVVNRGIGGDRVEWLNERLENSLAGLQPRLLVFLIAGNDVLAGESKEYILEAYNLLIDHAQTLCPNARILIESHYPLGGAWAEKGDTMYALNELEAEMAKAQGCFFLDVYSYLVKDGEMNMDYSVEGVHLNEKGYEIVTERLLNAFGKILS